MLPTQSQSTVTPAPIPSLHLRNQASAPPIRRPNPASATGQTPTAESRPYVPNLATRPTSSPDLATASKPSPSPAAPPAVVPQDPKRAPTYASRPGPAAIALPNVDPATSPKQIPPPQPGTLLGTEGAGVGIMAEGGPAQGPLLKEGPLVASPASAAGTLVGTELHKEGPAPSLPALDERGGSERLGDYPRDPAPRRGEDAEFAVEPEGEVQADVAPHAGLDGALHGRRRVKPETLAFRAAFREAAIAAAEAGREEALEVDLGEGEQGTPQWLRLRETRLTASAFGNALGFWPDGRIELWEEKVGLRVPFAGNRATEWGASHEAVALQQYCTLTGHAVQPCRFRVLRRGRRPRLAGSLS
eukprot:jgi/Botrbrau1/9230/Bobra.0028s0025.2